MTSRRYGFFLAATPLCLQLIDSVENTNEPVRF